MALNLDTRQRAMLAEMQVRVWSPVTAPEPAQPAPVLETAALAHEATPDHVPVASPAPRALVPVVPSAPTAHAAALAAAPVRHQTQRPEGLDQMDWASLQATVSSCQACTLCNTRHHTVFGAGAPSPEGQVPQVDWLILGDPPGEHEDLQGQPYVGPAGELLDNMLRACGALRAAPGGPQGGGVFITHVLKCRPPGNRNPKPEELAQCEPYLQRQVALLKPKIILAMGRFAAQALLQHNLPGIDSTPLGKLRGQVHSHQGVPVVVTYHPDYVLRNLPEKAKVWADLCLAMAQLRGRA